LPEDRRSENGLWGGIQLPNWDPDRVFALFQKLIEKKISKFELDEFSRFLMVFISQRLSKASWQRTLDQHRIERADAAGEMLRSIWAKIQRGKVKLDHPCKLVLMTVLNRIFERDMISLVRTSTKKSRVLAEQSPEDYEHADRRSATPEVDRLAKHLDEAVFRICGSDKMRRRAYKFLCRSVVQGRHLPAYDELPVRISNIMTVDVYAVLVFTINRLVNQFAADLA